jgi:hypothetical protein
MSAQKPGRREFLKTVGLGGLALISMNRNLRSGSFPAGSDDYTVACYYFPNYHVEPRNEAVHGPDWTEWELMKAARPRFKGHQQPKVPEWGYEDESDPEVMERKIDAAADNGIDAFIFDWYWYNDGPFLHRCLRNGFLKAPNVDRLKFGLMLANHDWRNIHPARLYDSSPVLYPGDVTLQTFLHFFDYVIEHYFKHPSYWKIDGAPYFSVFHTNKLLQSFGGVRGTRAAIDEFRSRTKKAGFRDLHFNLIAPQGIVLPETGERAEDPNSVYEQLGLDSLTSYHLLAPAGGMPNFPTTEYDDVKRRYLEFLKTADKDYTIPYFPSGMMGWDSTPRCLQSDMYINKGFPWNPVMVNNTPEAFRQSLQEIVDINDRRTRGKAPKIIGINAFNEWTEGSYLEPDTRYGMGYLNAIKKVFR